ncbi:MAG: hypothetical protein WCW02_00675 [Candidatus Buchananbacteria bacterium]
MTNFVLWLVIIAYLRIVVYFWQELLYLPEESPTWPDYLITIFWPSIFILGPLGLIKVENIDFISKH